MYKLLMSITVLLLFSAKIYSQCDTTTNLAAGLPQTAFFGSVTSDNLEPWRAFDTGAGSDTSHWGSTNGGQAQEIGFDLGRPVNVCSIYMRWGTNDYPTDFVVYGGADFSSFKVIEVVNGNTSSTFTVPLPDSGSLNVFKIYVYARHSGSSNYNLFDCKVYPRIGNVLPEVEITTPANGVSFLQGTNIDMTASASDTDGTVSKVEFYRDSVKIGQDTTAPYNFTWTGASVGSHYLTAKATDNLGGFTWSDTVHITVTNVPWIITGTTVKNANTGLIAIGAVPLHLPSDTSIKLSVNGSIYTKKLTVTQLVWADYVFGPDYHLRPIKELASFISKNKHLPDMPSATEVAANGLSIGDNQAILLKKVEELTLYIIEQHKKQEAQQKMIEEQNKKMELMKSEMEQLKKRHTKK